MAPTTGWRSRARVGCSTRQNDREPEPASRASLSEIVGEQTADVECLHDGQVEPIECAAVGVAGERPDLRFGYVHGIERRANDLTGLLPEHRIEANTKGLGGGAGKQAANATRMDLAECFETRERGNDDVLLGGDEL